MLTYNSGNTWFWEVVRMLRLLRKPIWHILMGVKLVSGALMFFFVLEMIYHVSTKDGDLLMWFLGLVATILLAPVGGIAVAAGTIHAVALNNHKDLG